MRWGVRLKFRCGNGEIAAKALLAVNTGIKIYAVLREALAKLAMQAENLRHV